MKAGRCDAILQELYKKERNQVITLINKTKADYYYNQINNCRRNSSATWKVINDINPNKKRKSNTNIFENTSDKTEEFNKHFSYIGQRTYEQTQQSLPDTHNLVVNPPNPALEGGPIFRPQPMDTNTAILTIKNL